MGYIISAIISGIIGFWVRSLSEDYSFFVEVLEIYDYDTLRDLSSFMSFLGTVIIICAVVDLVLGIVSLAKQQNQSTPGIASPYSTGNRFCMRCGLPLTSSATVCPRCSASTTQGVGSQSRAPQYGNGGNTQMQPAATCPCCGNPLSKNSRDFCTHCGKKLKDGNPNPPKQDLSKPVHKANGKRCPSCGQDSLDYTGFCTFCGMQH